MKLRPSLTRPWKRRLNIPLSNYGWTVSQRFSELESTSQDRPLWWKKNVKSMFAIVLSTTHVAKKLHFEGIEKKNNRKLNWKGFASSLKINASGRASPVSVGSFKINYIGAFCVFYRIRNWKKKSEGLWRTSCRKRRRRKRLGKCEMGNGIEQRK